MDNDVTRPKVFLAFAIYRDVYGETVTSLWNSLLALRDYEFQLSIHSSANVGFNRNHLVDTFLETDCDYIVFIDQDMHYSPHNLNKLLKDLDENPEIGVVSGLYIKRDGSLTPLSGWLEDGHNMKSMVYHLETLRDNRGELIPCDLLPTGFMGIRREVFDDVKPPYFHVVIHEDGTEWSSDSVFCRKVGETDWKLYLDLGIEVGHIGNYTYVPQDMYSRLDENLKYWKLHEIKQQAIKDYGVNTGEYWDVIWKAEEEYGIIRDKYEHLYNSLSGWISGRDNTILDLGSGPGNFGYMLHALGNKVTCADISQEALDMCKSRGIKDTLKLDVNSDLLPKEYRNKFDYIVSTELYEHVEDLDNFFKIVKFGLKDEGVFIMSCPNERLSPEEEPEHVRMVTPSTLHEYLKKNFEHGRVAIFQDFLLGVGSDGTPLDYLD